MGPQALSQKTLDHIGNFLVSRAPSRAPCQTHCCGYLQTDHAGIALEMFQCKCASANLMIGGVANISLCSWHLLGVTSSPLTPLPSRQKVCRHNAGGERPAFPLRALVWHVGFVTLIMTCDTGGCPPVQPILASQNLMILRCTLPYDTGTWRLGMGAPCRWTKGILRHSTGTPHTGMHAPWGWRSPSSLFVVRLLPFHIGRQRLFSETVALHAGHPTHKAHKPYNGFWLCGGLAGQHPGGTGRTAGKTTLLTLRRRKIGRAQKVRREDAQDSQGQNLGLIGAGGSMSLFSPRCRGRRARQDMEILRLGLRPASLFLLRCRGRRARQATTRLIVLNPLVFTQAKLQTRGTWDTRSR